MKLKKKWISYISPTTCFAHSLIYKMHVQGIENLQRAGICHRDMSLENLLVHESGALIIDMGMCLRLPIVADDETTNNMANNDHRQITASMQSMTMNGMPTGTQQPSTAAVSSSSTTTTSNTLKSSFPNDSEFVSDARSKRRFLVRPQGTCGKWIYMAPEIYKNNEPFDGYAVDMWAAGVILFLMLTGFPPWERACQTDERFKYMTAGYLVQMLTEWELGLSPDAMDLLQRMLFLDPKDRLSLEQVKAHPWMSNGPVQAPPSVSAFQ